MSTTHLTGSFRPSNKVLLPQLYGVIVWQILIGLGVLFGASQILQIERIFNLGNVIQFFLALVFTVVAFASFVSAYLIYKINSSGRLLGMAVNFVIMILALLYLGHITGFYLGFDDLAAGLYQNMWFLWGVVIGYLFVWMSNRFPNSSIYRFYLVRLGYAVIILCIVAVLLVSGLLINSLSSLITGLVEAQSLLVILLAVVLGGVVRYLLHLGEYFGETSSERDTWQGWLFLMPNLVSFSLFFAGPLLLSFYLSFTDYNPAQQEPARFLGLQNYGDMLSLSIGTLQSTDQPVNQVIGDKHIELARLQIGNSIIIIGARDKLFWISFFNTFVYCGLLLLFSIPTALGLAMLLNSKIPGMKFFRALFFIPSIAAVVGVALIWQWLYDPTIGYINYAIARVIDVINSLLGLQITDPAIQWLTQDQTLLLSVVIMAAWQVIGFNTVIFLAGLQGVPKELMEASTVDGANRWVRFSRIVLPLLGPTTFFVTITTLIAGLQAFAEPFSLIGENNPTTAKLTSVYYLYNLGFGSFRMGYASAVAWVLFIAIFIVTVIQFRLSRSNTAYSD